MIDLLSQNVMLRAALRAKRPQLLEKLQHITFEPGQEFWSGNARIPFALFPLRGAVSLQLTAVPLKRVDIALVGREGFAGVPLFFGMERSPMRAAAVSPGEGVTMPAAVFRGYLAAGLFRSAVERYIHFFELMLAEISLCNRVHIIDQLFIGRLLLMQDRTDTNSFQMTQDSFSRSLGVRTASIGRAAAQLQKLGAIQYDRRGRLIIRDRGQLEKLACSCYHAIKSNFDELLKTQR